MDAKRPDEVSLTDVIKGIVSCFAPDGACSEDAPSALMKCPAHAGREKRLKKKRQRHLKIAATLGSLREGAVAVRRLKEPA